MEYLFSYNLFNLDSYKQGIYGEIAFFALFRQSKNRISQCWIDYLNLFSNLSSNFIFYKKGSINCCFNFLEDFSPFWGHYNQGFRLLVMSVLGFKARVYLSVAWFVACNKFNRFISSATPADLLTASMAAGSFWSTSLHMCIKVEQHKNTSFHEFLWFCQLSESMLSSPKFHDLYY